MFITFHCLSLFVHCLFFIVRCSLLVVVVIVVVVVVVVVVSLVDASSRFRSAIKVMTRPWLRDPAVPPFGVAHLEFKEVPGYLPNQTTTTITKLPP